MISAVQEVDRAPTISVPAIHVYRPQTRTNPMNTPIRQRTRRWWTEEAARTFLASASTFSHWSQSCLGDNWQAIPPTGTEYRTGLDCGGAGLVTLPKQTCKHQRKPANASLFLSWIRTPWNILRSVYFFVSYLIYDTPRAGLLLVFMSVVKKVSENAPICNNSYENPPQQTKHAGFSLFKNHSIY